MRTTLETVDLIYSHLIPSSFASMLTGSVYKHKRPVDSKKEDVVVASLGIVNLDLQTAIVNVNIHVPDKSINANGANDFVADHARLMELEKAIQPFLDMTGADYSFNIQQANMFEDLDAHDHYINFRLEFYSINILN